MNQTLQSLLRLEELELLRQVLKLVGADVDESTFDFLNQRIHRARTEVPGSVLSRYDSIRRSNAEALAPASQNRCQGCGESIPARLALQLTRSKQIQCCPKCGRFLYPYERAPDYVTTK